MNFKNTYPVLAVLLLLGGQTLAPNFAAAENPANTRVKGSDSLIRCQWLRGVAFQGVRPLECYEVILRRCGSIADIRPPGPSGAQLGLI